MAWSSSGSGILIVARFRACLCLSVEKGWPRALLIWLVWRYPLSPPPSSRGFAAMLSFAPQITR